MSIPSPCTGVCTMDPSSALCRGCGRTIEEIVAWAGLDGAERRRIMDALPARLAAAEAADA